jgi:hypothetical protein
MPKPAVALQFRSIPRDSARGLRRVSGPGIGIRVGRRTAFAEVWTDVTGGTLVRFSTRWTNEWFAVRSRSRGVPQSFTTDWEDALADRLLPWFVDEIDD